MKEMAWIFIRVYTCQARPDFAGTGAGTAAPQTGLSPTRFNRST